VPCRRSSGLMLPIVVVSRQQVKPGYICRYDHSTRCRRAHRDHASGPCGAGRAHHAHVARECGKCRIICESVSAICEWRTQKWSEMVTNIVLQRPLTGMLFGITPEWCSTSDRNRVHLRPDSALE